MCCVFGKYTRVFERRKNKIADRKGVNYGFQFEFKKVNEFEGYKNPREEQYDFNVASLK